MCMMCIHIYECIYTQIYTSSLIHDTNIFFVMSIHIYMYIYTVICIFLVHICIIPFLKVKFEEVLYKCPKTAQAPYIFISFFDLTKEGVFLQ